MSAQRDVVVSEILCFILNKYGKVPENNVKQILINFYSDDEVVLGKDLFHKSLEKLKKDEVTRLVKRKGDNRRKMDVDDLLSLINWADEKLLLNKLPVFVVQNLDRVPLVKPEDLDIIFLAKKVTAMEEQMEQMKALVTEQSRVTTEDKSFRVKTSGQDATVKDSVAADYAQDLGQTNMTDEMVSSSTYGASILPHLTIVTCFFILAKCYQNEDHDRFNYMHQSDRAGDDIVKRPFFSGRIFSRPRHRENRWSEGQKSKSNLVKKDEVKRNHQDPETDGIDWPWSRYKRPFGPSVYARPPSIRNDKRPFGGSTIFSRPRGTTKPRFLIYGMSRERRKEPGSLSHHLVSSEGPTDLRGRKYDEMGSWAEQENERYYRELSEMVGRMEESRKDDWYGHRSSPEIENDEYDVDDDDEENGGDANEDEESHDHRPSRTEIVKSEISHQRPLLDDKRAAI